jgi:hypothetical protein
MSYECFPDCASYLRSRTPAPPPRRKGILANVRRYFWKGEYLCQQCLEIDFRTLLSPSAETDGLLLQAWRFNKESDLEEMRSSTCPLCRVLAVGMEGSVDGPFNRYGLIKFTGTVISPYSSPLALDGSNGFALLGIQISPFVPPELFLGLSTPPFSTCRDALASVQLIQDSQIDYEILKAWICSCQNDHGVGKSATCDHTERFPVQDLKIINCSTRQVEMAKEGCQYVALSYVWGLSVDQQSKHDINSIISDLPRTVQDAILVTLELGYHFLWVDRYCINQHCNDEKLLQINQMDRIYQGAQVTIIAMAGDDPSFGLPGVSRPRVGPFQVEIDSLKLGAIMHGIDDLVTIGNSKWNTRGWTYQEAVLSRRRLFFTEWGVMFDCPIMKCYETLTFPIKPEDDRWVRKTPSCGIRQNPLHIIRRISEYSGRQLSHSNDRLNAFKGVLEAYERLEHPVRHHWGVPILPPRVNHKLEKRKGKESSCAGFVLGLCWPHYTRGSKRLPEFPSWSWSGWDGKTNFLRHEEYLAESPRRADARNVRISVELANGRLLDWDDFMCDYFCRKSSVSSPASIYLLVDAWTVPVKLHYHHRDNARIDNPLEVLVSDGTSTYRFVYSSSMEADLTLSDTEINDIECGAYTGIVLGSRVKSNFVLVVQEKQGCMQRVGSFFLENPKEVAKNGVVDWDVNQFPWERRTIRLG